jgi:hypothetical protein
MDFMINERIFISFYPPYQGLLEIGHFLSKNVYLYRNKKDMFPLKKGSRLRRMQAMGFVYI